MRSRRPRHPPKLIERCPFQPETPVERLRVRVSLFFDGTLNNRRNIELFQDWKSKGENGEAPGIGSDSYRGDYTNVDKLSTVVARDQNQPGYDYAVPIYVEGIGTTNEGEDDLRGYAFGKGATGVKERVKLGLSRLVEEVTGRVGAINSTRVLECVHIDSFGFSRGAAAARHFTHVAMKTGSSVSQRLRASGCPAGEVRIRFVGLFDTVASLGVTHFDDTRELDLDTGALRDAEKVVQLAAAEEYRENFRLTNIDSVGSGLQFFLPGAHSDVGGGYVGGNGESQIIWKYTGVSTLGFFGENSSARIAIRNGRDADYRWMIERGWYRDSELQRIGDFVLKGTRTSISSDYSKIPLQIMARFARQTNLVFTPTLEQHEVPNALEYELGPVRAAIETKMKNGQALQPDTWFTTPDQRWRDFRNKHLHFSARYETAHAPQWEGGQIRGQRKRKIQLG